MTIVQNLQDVGETESGQEKIKCVEEIHNCSSLYRNVHKPHPGEGTQRSTAPIVEVSKAKVSHDRVRGSGGVTRPQRGQIKGLDLFTSRSYPVIGDRVYWGYEVLTLSTFKGMGVTVQKDSRIDRVSVST